MSEPTTTAAAAVLTGISALTMAALGVEPQTLVYGTIGAGVGTTFAPEMGKVKAIFMFFAVVCLCALAGTVAAQTWFSDGKLARNLIAAFVAMVFHPLISILVSRLQDVVDSLLRKAGLKQ